MDDVVNPARGESVEGETEQMRSQRLEEEFLEGLEETSGPVPQWPERDFLGLLPLWELLEVGRDHRPPPPALAEALGENLACGLLEDGLSKEEQRAVAQVVGERVLADDRLLGLAPWPDFERALARPRVAGADYRDVVVTLGRSLAEGLPFRGRDEWGFELGCRVAGAYRDLEELWSDCFRDPSKHTPKYLLPREQMRAHQTLDDPKLRALAEKAWDAKVLLHLTALEHSHPGYRQDPGRSGGMDYVVDSARLERVQYRIGKRLMAGAGLPEKLWPDSQRIFLAKAGAALLESFYVVGCLAMQEIEGMCGCEDYPGLLRRGLISAERCEEFELWARKDYDALVRRGTISQSECEWYKEDDIDRRAQRDRNRREAIAAAS